MLAAMVATTVASLGGARLYVPGPMRSIMVAIIGVLLGASFAAAPEPFRVHARIFERPPAGLQHQPLLGVEQLRFHRGDAEERGVELVEPVEVGAETAGDALHLAIREQLSDAADAGAGLAFLHRVHPVVEQSPEGRDGVRAGEPAGHADDRNRRFGPGDIRFAGLGPDGRCCGGRGRFDRLSHRVTLRRQEGLRSGVYPVGGRNCGGLRPGVSAAGGFNPERSPMRPQPWCHAASNMALASARTGSRGSARRAAWFGAINTVRQAVTSGPGVVRTARERLRSVSSPST